MNMHATRAAQAVDTPERNRLVVSAYLDRAAGRKGVAFCCTVEHASNLADAFRCALLLLLREER